MEFSRESVFVSSVRSFCKTIAVMVGILAGGFVLFLFFGASSPQNFLPERSDMTILPDASGNRSLLPTTVPVILRFDIHGIIGDRDMTRERIENLLLDSREGLFYNNRVKAILLHFDTPGGTVVDADGIYRLLKEYKAKYQVPIYGFVDGLCASGGMYISSSADKMYASSTSIIGSIGVIQGPYFNVSDLMQKYGVQSKTLSQGKDKDPFNSFRPWKVDEGQSLVDLMNYFYEQFVTIVTEARPQLNKKKLVEEYGAHIFDAARAQDYGFIDVAGANYQVALTDLVKAAGIGEKEEYQVIALTPKHSLFSQLTDVEMGLLKGKVQHTFPLGPYINSEMSGKMLYLYQP